MNHASNAFSHSPVGEPQIAEMLAEQDDRIKMFDKDDQAAKH